MNYMPTRLEGEEETPLEEALRIAHEWETQDRIDFLTDLRIRQECRRNIRLRRR
jgi:hypothetical protein